MSELSGYRLMWLIAIFDLPVKTKVQRKDASDYRKLLLEKGFQMAQLSVYFKYCHDKEQADVVTRDISKVVPKGGRVDVIAITDRQYAGIVTIRDSARVRRENPSQLALF
jgi:CRISPR-associated protein Cas2